MVDILDNVWCAELLVAECLSGEILNGTVCTCTVNCRYLRIEVHVKLLELKVNFLVSENLL